MLPSHMVDHALAWAGRGFPVFPLREGGKEPALKGNWKDMATKDPERIKRLWGRHEYNVGVVTVDTIVVDIDDKPGKSGSADWSLLSYPDDTLTIGTPSGGRHLFYHSTRATGQPALTRSIDIRAAGIGYVAGAGSKIGDKEYTILKDVPIMEAPESLVEHCQRRKKTTRDVAVEMDTDSAVERAAAYLKSRKGVPEGNRDNWTFVTACEMIDFGVSAEMCFDLLLEWDEKNDPPLGEELVREKVDSAWRNRSLPPGVSTPEAEFNGVSIPEPQRKPRTRPKVMWAGDPNLDLTQQWLMFNRFPRIGTAMVVGPSGSGKTFLSLDLAVAMAEGREWLGKEADEQIGAIILSAEGIGGLPSRMKPLSRCPVVATTIALLSDDKGAQELVDTVSELRGELKARFDVRLGLIVIDTLNSAGLLTNENDNAEIGRALRVIEKIAEMFSCLVLVTHHPPKHGTGARGGYALHAGFDTVVEIFKEPHKRERFVECTKGRDAKTGAWGSFVLEPYIVEPDPTGRGRDITTQRVIFGTETRNITKDKVPSETRLEAFVGAFDSARVELKLSKGSAVPIDALRDCYVRSRKWRHGDATRHFNDCLEWSKDAGKVVVVDDEKEGTLITESASDEEE